MEPSMATFLFQIFQKWEISKNRNSGVLQKKIHELVGIDFLFDCVFRVNS